MRYLNFTGLVVFVFFGCSDAPPTIDGYTYKTIKIGEQEWFAENLKTTVYANGEAIPHSLSDADWTSTASGAMAFDTATGAMAFDENILRNSGLYNWYAVDDARGLCPSGWHVPSDNEWMAMIDYLGGDSVAGGHMKTEHAWHYVSWNSDNRGIVGKDTYHTGNGTNSSGFSGLPAGQRDPDGYLDVPGGSSSWWSSTSDGINAWEFSLHAKNEDVKRVDVHPNYGFPVRCLKTPE